MTKTSASSSKHSSMCAVAPALAVILFLGFAVLAYKYAMLKTSWQTYAVQTLNSTNKQRDMADAEDATLFGMTITQYPVGAPLYKQPQELQKYVAAINKQTHRDIVVMDTNKTIWADAVPTNIGQKFAEDKDNEIMQTIGDGQTRTFVELSKDYPQGVDQVVVPLKDATGKTVGAVVMSTSTVFN